jgi:Ner family transcriptional regulator
MAKKSTPQDWHRADIKCALDKKGTSMAHLSRVNGYGKDSLRVALRTPWPKAEAIIAAAIGIKPQTIWPTRYRPDGSPKSGRGERGLGRYKPSRVCAIANKQQYTDATPPCNGNKSQAA